jgi:hypothetical protein
MNEQQSGGATEVLERMRLVGRLSTAAMVATVAERAQRIGRPPADPADLMVEEVLVSLRRINREVERAIERIEDAQRDWRRAGRAVVVGGGGPGGAGRREPV